MSRPRTERPRVLTIFSHLGVMVIVSAVLGVVVSGLAIPFAGLVGFTARSTATSVSDLPQELDSVTLPQRTTIVDAGGNVIASVYDQNRTNVSLSDVSRTMVKALLSIEDYRFYEHGAIDVKGTLRALVTNTQSGGVVQGGSTITQQLVKLTLLQQAKTAKQRKAVTADTYARKFKELRYAIALEKAHSKDWILEQYLNTAYFGDGAYGVQAAARHYFNVNASDLDLNQSAILGGLVQNPSAFDPTNYPARTVDRRNVVLARMAQLHVISARKARTAEKAGLQLDTQPADNGCVNSRAPFFCDYVLSYLEHDRALGKNLEERKSLLYSGGLTIKTTIDLRYQRAADASVRAHVYPKDNAIGALAMVQPGTGEVKALAQSRPMGADSSKGQTYLNYLVPKKYGDSNGFQAGSTFKLFVLASAITDHVPLSTTISSPQQVSIPNNQYKTCNGPYPSTQVWSPQNSTGAGTFNLYTGTQNSVNTFFAQLERMTGLCQPYSLAQQMGVQLTNKTTEMVPTFTLGVSDVSPLEMAGAYATVAARGMHCDSRPVTEIDAPDGTLLKSYDPHCTRVMPQSTADAVNAVLKGVQEPGGFGYGAGISLNDRDDAGKTGTTDNNKAVWFDGYTPQLATVAMIAGANDFGTPITLNYQSIGPGIVTSAHGSTTAGPMWGQAMKAIEKYFPPTPFSPITPLPTVGTPVPSVSGQSTGAASGVLQGSCFKVKVAGEVPSSYYRGAVAATAPTAGTPTPCGTTVTVFTSTGTPPVTYAPPPPPSTPSTPAAPANHGGGGGGGGHGGPPGHH